MTTYKKQLDFNFKFSEDMESLGKEAQKQILVKITDEIVKRGAYNLNIRIDTKEIL